MIWKLLACIFMTVTAAFIVTVIMDIRKKKKTSLTFKDSIHSTGLPIISLKLQIPDKTFITYNFIVDTGSTVNVINTSCVKDLYSEDIKLNTELYGIGGNSGEAKKYRLYFINDNNLYSGEFVSKDLSSSLDYIEEITGYTIHGLIGTNFLEEFKYKIDFSKYQLYK